MTARAPRQQRAEERAAALSPPPSPSSPAMGRRPSRRAPSRAQAGLPLASVSYYYPRLDDLLAAALHVVLDGWLARAVAIADRPRRGSGRGAAAASRALAAAFLPDPATADSVRARYEHLLAAARIPAAAAALARLRPELAAAGAPDPRPRGRRIERHAGHADLGHRRRRRWCGIGGNRRIRRMPCGGRCTSFSPRPRPVATPPSMGVGSPRPFAEPAARDPFVRLDVTLTGRRHDRVRKRRRRLLRRRGPSRIPARSTSSARSACRRTAAHGPGGIRRRTKTGTSPASAPRRRARDRRPTGRTRAWCRRSGCPRRTRARRARSYNCRVSSRSRPAVSAPTRATTSANAMFSSCSPSSALVAGVKIGSGSREASTRPGGSGTPQTRPVRR